MRSLVINADFFNMIDLILIGYMFLGCIVSLVIVYFELMITVKKVNEADIYATLRADNPDLVENTESKVKLWINKDKKMTRVLVYPNFFQIISK